MITQLEPLEISRQDCGNLVGAVDRGTRQSPTCSTRLLVSGNTRDRGRSRGRGGEKMFFGVNNQTEGMLGGKACCVDEGTQIKFRVSANKTGAGGGRGSLPTLPSALILIGSLVL